MQRKGELHTLLVELKIGAAAMEYHMEIPQKIKNRITIQSSNFTSGYLSEENEFKNIYMSLCSLKYYLQQPRYGFTIANISAHQWMDKNDVVHIYNGTLLNRKKEWLL